MNLLCGIVSCNSGSWAQEWCLLQTTLWIRFMGHLWRVHPEFQLCNPNQASSITPIITSLLQLSLVLRVFFGYNSTLDRNHGNCGSPDGNLAAHHTSWTTTMTFSDFTETWILLGVFIYSNTKLISRWDKKHAELYDVSGRLMVNLLVSSGIFECYLALPSQTSSPNLSCALWPNRLALVAHRNLNCVRKFVPVKALQTFILPSRILPVYQSTHYTTPRLTFHAGQLCPGKICAPSAAALNRARLCCKVVESPPEKNKKYLSPWIISPRIWDVSRIKIKSWSMKSNSTAGGSSSRATFCGLFGILTMTMDGPVVVQNFTACSAFSALPMTLTSARITGFCQWVPLDLFLFCAKAPGKSVRPTFFRKSVSPVNSKPDFKVQTSSMPEE